jgi:hypothetical protein
MNATASRDSLPLQNLALPALNDLAIRPPPNKRLGPALLEKLLLSCDDLDGCAYHSADAGDVT